MWRYVNITFMKYIMAILQPRRSFQICPNILVQGVFARPYVSAPLYYGHHIRALHAPRRPAAIQQPFLSSSLRSCPNVISIRFVTSSNSNPNPLQKVLKTTAVIGGRILALAFITPLFLLVFGASIYRFLKNGIGEPSHFPSRGNILFHDFGKAKTARPGHSRDQQSPLGTMYMAADLLRGKAIASISDALVSGNHDLVQNLGRSADICALQFTEVQSVSPPFGFGASVTGMTVKFLLGTRDGKEGVVVAKGKHNNGVMDVKEIEIFWGPTLKTQIPLSKDFDMSKRKRQRKRQRKMIEGEFHDV